MSDLVSTGIIRELYLDVLVETFNKWLTKYLVHEMKKLGEAEEKRKEAGSGEEEMEKKEKEKEEKEKEEKEEKEEIVKEKKEEKEEKE